MVNNCNVLDYNLFQDLLLITIQKLYHSVDLKGMHCIYHRAEVKLASLDQKLQSCVHGHNQKFD